jgi:hypothetical protein
MTDQPWWDEQWHAARRYVTRVAPDCLEILGMDTDTPPAYSAVSLRGTYNGALSGIDIHGVWSD